MQKNISFRDVVGLILAFFLVMLIAEILFGQTFPRLEPIRHRPSAQRDNGLAICRLQYFMQGREEGGNGWATDYSRAEVNLMRRISQVTSTAVDLGNDDGPSYWVVRATDESLFNCTVLMAADVGTISFSPLDVPLMREYLLKGGFLWVDDFWGTKAWDHWVAEISEVFPPEEYPIRRLPTEHPIFNTLYSTSEIPQIPNMRFWLSGKNYWGNMGSPWPTSERGADSEVVNFRVITDSDGRVMVAMTHNTDISDSFEEEAIDESYTHTFSADGYTVGINLVLYALTH